MLMCKRFLAAGLITGMTLFLAGTGPLLAQQEPGELRAVLDRNCVSCHNDTLKTANVVLDLADISDLGRDPQLWEKVITKLSLRAMPPVGMPVRPSEDEYQALLTYLTSGLDKLAQQRPEPGRPTIHRLNRTEYTNAVRDLLNLELNVAALLPPDNVDAGFDNIAEVLAVSPLLMEQYVLAAGKISRAAIGPTAMLPVSETYTVSEENLQRGQMSEDLPFGSRGGLAARHYFPMQGEYILRVRLARNGEGFIRGLRREQQLEVRLDRKLIQTFSVGGQFFGRTGPIFTHSQNPDFAGDADQLAYEMAADKDFEIRFRVDAGTHLIGVTFPDDRAKTPGYLTPELQLVDTGNYKGGDAAVDSVVITGPYGDTAQGQTASRERIFACMPKSASENLGCAHNILSTLAHRAFRRPVQKAEMDDLLEVYEQGERLNGFEGGIDLALQRILAGPEFLFRIEQEPAGAAAGTIYPLSDLDLASRLSFFLWSSIPDDELLGLAELGRLRATGVLAQQVKRMLADPRSDSLITNFADQWLALRKVDLAAPQKAMFPEFDGALRSAMKKEMELWFGTMLREDRSVRELLTSDFTYVNDRLARHYGIPEVYGSNFRRVKLDNPDRAGMLGKAGLLMVTSYNSRTSPVVRGKWVLENMLDMAPPPPPADAFQPELQVEDKEGKVLTMKQAMEEHRKNPVCANCHKMMEPIGLALENFDGIGSYRTRYDDANAEVDSSGILFDGKEFKDANGFRQEMLKHQDRFVHTVIGKLLTYAVGRKLDYYDQPTVREIFTKSKPDNHTWSSLILGIIESKPFQNRRTQP